MDQHHQSYQLGFEELVMAIGLAGEPDTAKKLLITNLGISNADENRGRLLSANHSLISKGYVVLKNNIPHLQEDFKHLIEIIIKYDFSLRLNFGTSNDGHVLAFCYLGDEVIEHKNLPGSVQHFSWVTESKQIIQEGLHFLRLQECKDFICPEAEIRQSFMEEAKKKAATQPDTLLGYLKKINIPEKTATLLSADLIQPDFRGSVLRVERKNGGMISDQGFLVMVHKPRAWLFPIFLKHGEPYARILAGSESSFKKEVLALVK